MSFALMMLGGLAVDLVFGWPNALFRNIGHPVTWIGRVISAVESRWNKGDRAVRFRNGTLAVGFVVVLTAVPYALLQSALPDGILGVALGAILAWPLIAARSMHAHVRAVALPLHAGDLQEARSAVAMIVGRDPAALDEAGIARAAIESLAENTSDGVVAPLFWGVVAGLPGIAVYKAINTMDSMIGHRSDRYEAYGKVAARLDDAVNWVPARLTGLLFALAAGPRFLGSTRVMAGDAGRHRSPNAGWPEAAVAGALDIRLSGPRIYENHVAEEPWLNEGAPDPGAEDVFRALELFRRCVGLVALALLGLALV